MSKVINKNIALEILIATVNRDSLDFLKAMFSKVNLQDYTILIVNQTTKEKLLKSDNPKLRIINSFEKGLSKSRNLAIENAIAPICLLADDDVVFIPGFEEKIRKAHSKHKAEIITFQTETTEGNLYWKYPKKSTVHTDFITRKTLSIEITFKREGLKTLRFNEDFGLGAKFEDAENYIFLSEAKKRGLGMFFVPETLSVHPPISSSDEVESDRLLYAKSAVSSYKYGKKAYLWVLKFVFFLFRKKYISASEIKHKLNVGFGAIKDYQKIKNA